MTTDIVADALTMAWFRLRPEPGVIHHLDRGNQYASHAFQDKLKEFGMTCSMGRKGNCWDNAPRESFVHTLKVKRVHPCHYKTRDEAKRDVFHSIEGYDNRTHIHSAPGYLTPLHMENKLS